MGIYKEKSKCTEEKVGTVAVQLFKELQRLIQVHGVKTISYYGGVANSTIVRYSKLEALNEKSFVSLHLINNLEKSGLLNMVLK